MNKLFSIVLSMLVLASSATADPLRLLIPDDPEETVNTDLSRIFMPKFDFSQDLDLTFCGKPRLGKPCLLLLEGAKFGTKTILLCQRLVSGKLKTLGRFQPDVNGKLQLRLVFEKQGPQNLILLLMDKNNDPLGMDGAVFDVLPPSDQLGEQSKLPSLIFQDSPYPEPVPDDDYYFRD